MTRHEFLAALHRQLRPRNYLEIGVADGRSLALSRVPSIGVDPQPKIKAKIVCDAQVVKATSDDFFARPDPLAHFRDGRGRSAEIRRFLGRVHPALAGRPSGPAPTIDLAFIDGMHWFEYALRDFMNVERLSSPATVIVFDDVLPRSVIEAARDRKTQFWAGDVFKIIDVLKERRPDLIVVPVNTEPTGVLVVLAPDARNSVLDKVSSEIAASKVVADPQDVPETVLRRLDAVDPREFLETSVWSDIVRARESGLPQDFAVRLRATVDALPRGAGPVPAAPTA